MAAVFSGGPEEAGSEGVSITGALKASQTSGMATSAGVNITEGTHPEKLGVSNRRDSISNEVTTGFFNGVAGSSAGGAAMQNSGVNDPSALSEPTPANVPAIRLKNKNARHSSNQAGGLEIELEPDSLGRKTGA